MKLIIDIPEDVYKKTVFYREFRDLNDFVATIKSLENGTPIPDNATNEDILNTMFDRKMAYNITYYVENYMLMGEWLNAPYQKGGKE